MDKWEYTVLVVSVSGDNNEVAIQMLNQLGAQGWEMTAAATLGKSYQAVYFKRRLQLAEVVIGRGGYGGASSR